MRKINKISFEDVLNEVHEYIRAPESLALITKAYEFANEKHSGQYRKSV